MLKERIMDKKMSVKDCAVLSGISYTTLIDLVNGRTKLSKTSSGLLYRLARTLGVSMEELLEEDDAAFGETWENFRSNVKHQLKSQGDIAFLKTLVSSEIVFDYWKRGRRREALYLVAMADYLCRISGVQTYTGFSQFRNCSLKKPLYAQDVLLLRKIGLDAIEEAHDRNRVIPEFRKMNIMEEDIRDVC